MGMTYASRGELDLTLRSRGVDTGKVDEAISYHTRLCRPNDVLDWFGGNGYVLRVQRNGTATVELLHKEESLGIYSLV